MQSTAFYRWMGFGALLIALLGVVRIATHSDSSSPKTNSGQTQHHGGQVGGGKKHHHHHHGANPSPTASTSPAAGHHHHHHAAATATPSASATTASTQPSTGGGNTSTPTSHPTHTSSSGSGGGSSIVTPAYGSYPYATSGSESAAGTNRNYPSSSKITIAKDGSCASSTWQPISQHKEVQVICPAGSTEVKLHSESQTISFFGFGATQNLTCDSKALVYSTLLKAGDAWQFTCKSSSTTAKQKANAIGFQTFSIGGKSIKAMHIHVVTAISGGDSGTSIEDYWYAPKLGMVVKQAEKVNAKQGSINYKGHYTLTLTSTKPS